MNLDPIQLLRKLEPAVRPTGAPAGGRTPTTPLERSGFDELLALVSRGVVESARPVTIGVDAQLESELDPDQRQRLAAAGDRAEAAGSRRAVMLIDGRGLVMNVPGREITAELAAGSSRDAIEIDTAVYVASADEAETAKDAVVHPPGTGLVPPNVARQLPTRGPGVDDAGTRGGPPARKAG